MTPADRGASTQPRGFEQVAHLGDGDILSTSSRLQAWTRAAAKRVVELVKAAFC